jgi:RNase P subunit RPR2
MTEKEFIIITCQKCKVKNRIKAYDSSKLPICAKCKAPLIDLEENEVHSKYGKNLKSFLDLPDIGLR